MIATRRTILNREYTLYGVNAEMLTALETSEQLYRLMEPFVAKQQLITKALGGGSTSERIIASKQCVMSLWRRNIPFGPYSLLDLLAQFEFDRKFYAGYRDHSAHQLKVALLGFYFVQICRPLRDLMHEKYGDSFEVRWILTALSHDLGYVFETGDATESSDAERTIKELNRIGERPLYEFIKWRHGDVILPAQCERFMERAGLTIKKLTCFDDLRKDQAGIDLLDDVEPLASHAHLGAGDRPIQTYLRFARSNRPKGAGRPPFIDHGIASSYLLLASYRRCLEWGAALDAHRAALNVPEELHRLIVSDVRAIADLRPAVVESAAAIALHNIWAGIWDADLAYRWENSELTLNRFMIDMASDPLAGLLAITDTVQGWDRPHFAAPESATDDNAEAQSQDIHIIPHRDGIGICFSGDALSNTGHPKSRYQVLVNSLSQYVANWQAAIPLHEVGTKGLEAVVAGLDWGGCLVESEKATSSTSFHLILPESPNNNRRHTGYDLYRRGRSLANNAAWLAAAECHIIAARVFQEDGALDWAARSLGRAAVNKLDYGNTSEAQEHMARAVELDAWQGVSNYYNVVQHCARGAGDNVIAGASLNSLINAALEIMSIAPEFETLLKTERGEWPVKFDDCMAKFFERLVTREIAAGWPDWSMSDAARMYVLRAALAPDLAASLLESAASAYEETELSSYAAWCRVKAALSRASQASDVNEFCRMIFQAQEHTGKVIQRPGGELDVARLVAIVLSALDEACKFYMTRDAVYKLAYERRVESLVPTSMSTGKLIADCKIIGACLLGSPTRPEDGQTSDKVSVHLLTDFSFSLSQIELEACRNHVMRVYNQLTDAKGLSYCPREEFAE